MEVSVLDSIVQGGDGVWEGLRIYKGKVFKLEEHLDRSKFLLVNVSWKKRFESNLI